MKVLTVKEVSSILRIGKNQAYSLMNSEAFPSFRIGNRLLVDEDALNDWIVKVRGKTISI